MMGTLARFLGQHGIDTPEDRYWAEVEGDIEDVDNVLKITKVRVKYTIKVPKGKTGGAREALGSYITYCPAAQSVIGCIDITDEANIVELDS